MLFGWLLMLVARSRFSLGMLGRGILLRLLLSPMLATLSSGFVCCRGSRCWIWGASGGSIALPLAQAGHTVVAADYSPAMLRVLQEGIEHVGVQGLVRPVALAWEDDWAAHGVASKSVDVAFASRSMTAANMKRSLSLLDRCARRRCCITLATGAGPHRDAHILDAIGCSYPTSQAFVYAFNILVQMGALPRIEYFTFTRRDTFDSLEEGLADFARMLAGGNEDKLPRLRCYLADHMVENPDAGKPGSKGTPQGTYMLDHTRIVSWAFLSWTPCLELA